ncbi:asparagine synthase (glutamine-hydrolyzing) [Candidatus Magnetominusculus xianensis]|uniref:asparagine synthase (glutamine-hydrolyzing) n=1 Tax=Candidatus Magnetominusculus xianensis TaxID=1748249 RepID=A0ABR5SDG7_9BACT|nr:asparagine synthase (glutamine-hydrolyzing) [Candidatus Magnetominusculus xianensis]KWT78307.1 asparagine synthetase B [Candidatus Magnetominusculus xianensis]MBF0404006.1 asparagine synthase (glutamine-hydrolyzing) [Nitrospirota bacterium]
MCGIAGFISENRDYDAEKIVASMLGVMSYRGPDQYDVKSWGSAALGMVRLSIIGRQHHEIPYEDEGGRYAAVYNGEIYNHDTIRSALLTKYAFKTDSDAETALYNYIDKGVRSFDDYNGMYAFVIYDSQEKSFCIVRDKTGEKPMYYTCGKDFFAFASEMKSLLKVLPARFNSSAISYNAYEFTVGSETLFKDILSLEPGEYIKADARGFTKHEYWKLWNNIIEVPDDKKKILKYLHELVEDAIYLRTKNCVHQFGCFISGGLDSAIAACIAKPDYLYTVHYDYDDFDELDYARLVAAKLKKELVVITPSKEDFLRTKETIAFHLDTPCTWTSFSLWMLLERACKDIKVVMTGDGADEVFAGYYRYLLLYHDEQIKQVEALNMYSYLINKYYGSAAERYAKLVNRCENQFDKAVNTYLRESIGYYFDKVNGDIVHAMGLNDFYSTMQVLLQMSDRLSMAMSIENRSPFLDYRLVQYGFSMPSKYKIKGGVTKWALKEIAKKIVPKEIILRTDKRGFSAPVNKWFEWDKTGKYDRTAYKNMVYGDWKKIFKVKNA